MLKNPCMGQRELQTSPGRVNRRAVSVVSLYGLPALLGTRASMRGVIEHEEEWQSAAPAQPLHWSSPQHNHAADHHALHLSSAPHLFLVCRLDLCSKARVV